MKKPRLCLTAFFIPPLAALCAAADTPQPTAQPASREPTPASLAEAETYRSKGDNVLFIAVR